MSKIAYHTSDNDVKIYMETSNGVKTGGPGHTYNQVRTITHLLLYSLCLILFAWRGAKCVSAYVCCSRIIMCPFSLACTVHYPHCFMSFCALYSESRHIYMCVYIYIYISLVYRPFPPIRLDDYNVYIYICIIIYIYIYHCTYVATALRLCIL